jgi:hypothetical protein
VKKERRMELGRAAYITSGPSINQPAVRVELVKLGNGYMTELIENRQQPEPEVKEDIATAVEAELDPPSVDEQIDRMVEGLGAFMRSVHDKGAGEDWKEDGDKEKIRAAVKLFMPNVVRSDVGIKRYVAPRQESLVFESKKSLMEYLEKNL